MIEFLMSDVGLGMFFAWVMFAVGVINISREVHIFAIDYSKKIYLCEMCGFLRIFLGSLCLYGWWYLLGGVSRELW